MKHKVLTIILSFVIFALLTLAIIGICIKSYLNKIDNVYYNSCEMLLSNSKIELEANNYDEKCILEYFDKLSLDLNKINNLSFDNYKKEYLNPNFYNNIDISKNNINFYIENKESNIKQFKASISKELFIKYLTDNNVNDIVVAHLNNLIDKDIIDTKDIDNKLDLEKENFNNLFAYIDYLKSERNNWSYEAGKVISTSDKLIENINNKNKEYNIDVKTIVKVEEPIDNSKRIPILMYHGVSDETWGIENLFIKVSDFEKQMKYISENFETIFIEDIDKDYSDKRVVSLTFDDAYVDFYTNVFPILKKYNLKANLYVIVNFRGDKYLDANQIKEISNSGLVSIGSHTLNHLSLKKLNDVDLNTELKKSKEELGNLIGKEVRTLCYPTGAYSSKVISAASKYYDYALAIHNDVERMNNNFNKYAIKRYRMYRNTSFNSFKEKVEMAN